MNGGGAKDLVKDAHRRDRLFKGGSALGVTSLGPSVASRRLGQQVWSGTELTRPSQDSGEAFWKRPASRP